MILSLFQLQFVSELWGSFPPSLPVKYFVISPTYALICPALFLQGTSLFLHFQSSPNSEVDQSGNESLANITEDTVSTHTGLALALMAAGAQIHWHHPQAI